MESRTLINGVGSKTVKVNVNYAGTVDMEYGESLKK